MAVQIQFRRGTAEEWATVDPVLAVAEMGIETDTDLFKIGDGNTRWNVLDYGGLRGYNGSTGFTGSIGNMAVSNVLYVSESGNDNYSGTSLNLSKRTIQAALAIATRGTTIFVKSGDYTENNPLLVPDFVSVVGDNLRSVIVRPQNVTQDLFYVNNGCYLAHMTFKDHVSPAAAVAFNPDGSAGVISTSPYVQNCTSMTSNGTGMRVDGDHALGTKSMVVDAYTQYNQGGIGIHMLNLGYTQLVSVFTICCDKGFLCESGGSCSITNSNSSFGNYALYANGVSTANYSGKLNGATGGQEFVIDNLTTKPAIGDAVSFGTGDYYTIASSTAFKTGSTDITYPSLTAESATYRNARQAILDERTRLQVETIKHVLEAFPGFDFNQFKCSRDVGDIIDSIAYDMVLHTNYRTIKAATSYYRASGSTVVTSQKTQTVSAINFLKVKVLALLYQGPSDPYSRVSGLFTIFLDIIQNGLGVTPAFVFNPPTGASTATVNASLILQNNKDFIAAETVSYISNFTYNTTSCYRDTGLIVDSLAFDLLHGGNSQSAFAGLQYWSQDTYTGNIFNQLTTTTAAIAQARDIAIQYITTVTNLNIINTVTNNFNIIIDVLNNGAGGITDRIVPNTYASINPYIIAGYNKLVDNKTNIQNYVMSWLEVNYPTFSYDETKCRRDTGLIVDSIAFDLLYDGVSQSAFAGLQYWNQDGYVGDISSEITTTTNAIIYLKNAAASIALSTGGTTAQTELNSKFNILLSTLANVTGVTDNIVPNGAASTNANKVSVYNALLSNKSTLQDNVLAYVESTKTAGFTYNTSTCYRDVGYIIDSVAFDYLHGGNRQSIMSAVYYYGFNSSSSVIPNEITQTTAAYDFIKTISNYIVQGIPVQTNYQSVVKQTTSTNVGTTAEANKIIDKINIIENIIINGPVVAPEPTPIGLTPSSTSTVVNSFNLLLANRSFIQAETIAYINSTYSYDRVKCRRDVGYIIDSVAFDLLHSGNRQSIMSGVYYYGFNAGSSVIRNEIPQTTAAYNFIRDISAKVITGTTVTNTYQNLVSQIPQAITTTTGGTAEIGIINGLVNTITDIINNGPSMAPAHVPIGLTASTSTSVIGAYELLLLNRSFIQAETIAYINTSYVGLVYSTATCKRDVGYIIDAVTYDVLYGGNSQTADAADSYYDGAVFRIDGREKPATIAAYYFIKTIIDDCLINNDISPKQQLVVPQNTSVTAATSTQSAIAQALVDIVANIVENAYSSTITVEEFVPSTINDNTVVTFHQYSLITSSGHSFEWIGAGVNINAALPYLGGEPISTNQAVEVNGGKVYFTGTDQRGDFRIGNDLTINRNLGTISGRTFTKSLFAVMTPYILAIGS